MFFNLFGLDIVGGSEVGERLWIEIGDDEKAGGVLVLAAVAIFFVSI